MSTENDMFNAADGILTKLSTMGQP
jgi:hypothetical protein